MCMCGNTGNNAFPITCNVKIVSRCDSCVRSPYMPILYLQSPGLSADPSWVASGVSSGWEAVAIAMILIVPDL